VALDWLFPYPLLPSQVQQFCQLWPMREAKRWCFDLDNTLVTHPTVVGEYASCRPIPHMIQVRRGEPERWVTDDRDGSCSRVAAGAGSPARAHAASGHGDCEVLTGSRRAQSLARTHACLWLRVP
jgi:hypothetical protein